MASEESILEPVVQIDAGRFTDTERELILQVVARDEDIRIQEKNRIDQLKDELYDLKEKSVSEEDEETCGRVCRRCRTPLGLLFNSGALCPSCLRTVCKTCRVPIDEGSQPWVCTVCGKIRELRADSGAWFYTEPTPDKTKTKKKKVYGSFLMKRVFSRTRKNDGVIFSDPDWSNVLEKEEPVMSKEQTIEDNTYLVISPAVSGQFNVREETTAVIAEEEKSEKKVEKDVPAEEKGLNDEDRSTLLSILQRSNANTPSQSHTPEEEKQSIQQTGFTQNDEEDESTSSEIEVEEMEETLEEKDQTNKDEPSTQASIYYTPEEESSSSDEGEKEVEESEQMKIIPQEYDKDLEESKQEMKKIHTGETQNLDSVREEKGGKLDSASIEDKIEQSDVNKSVTSDIDLELLELAKESSELSSSASNRIVNDVDEEPILNSPTHKFKNVTRVGIDEKKPFTEDGVNDSEISSNIDFASMQKIGTNAKTSNVHVIYNDMDLQPLMNEMFGRNKRLKFEKLKTDEHSDDGDHVDSDSSSSSDSVGDIRISQVVLKRRNSSEEEFEDFKFSVESNFSKKETLDLENEVISTKVRETKSFKPKKDESQEPILSHPTMSKINGMEFSAMTKIADLPTFEGQQQNLTEDNDGHVDAFIRSMSKRKFREKLSKLRSEEHSDKDVSSSGEETEETEGNDVLIEAESNPDKKVHYREPIIAKIPENEPDDIEEMFAEYAGRHDDIGDADSIGSNYSDDDNMEQAAQVAGEIYIGLRYDHKAKLFEVQVHKAKGLIIGDPLENTSNSYAKVYLLPNTKRSAKRKTKIVKKTLHPVYDEILTFKLEYDQLLSRTCGISVWHSNFTQKNKRLGEVFINIEEYLNSGFQIDDPTPQWYTLTGRIIEREHVEFVGELFANISFHPPSTNADVKKKQNPTKGELHVHVAGAHNLKAIHEGEFSNPFCKIQLISPNSKTEKFKTHHVKGTTEPNWDKRFVFSNIAMSDLQIAILQFTVWDVEKGSSHALLGGARLSLGTGEGDKYDSFGEEVSLWQRVIDQPNETTECAIPLRSTMDSVKAKAFVPPTPVRVVTINDHDSEQSKKSGSQGNLAKRLLQPDAISLASTGSMLSLYSNAGGDGDLIVTGEILFSVKYDDISGIFSVNIDKAKNLAAVDTKKMTSDPYVKIYLLPDKLKTSKKKTLHRRKTTNPIWNETIKYKLSKEELLTKTLQLTIWNHDRFGKNDCLGEVQLNMKQYAKTNRLEADTPVWYTLQELAPVIGGGADDNKGELVVGLKFDKEILTVNIKEAHGLPSLDSNTLPNPFVKCYFLPDKSRKSKRKTGVEKKTIAPVWNEKFTYKHVSVDDLQTRVIEITVWDYNSSAHQFLGGVRLGLPNGDENYHDCHDSEVSIWQSMISHLGILAEYRIPLRKTMSSMKGQIEREIPMITSNIPPSINMTLKEEKEEVTNNEVLPPGPNQSTLQSYRSREENLDGVPSIRLSLQYASPEALDEAEEGRKKKKKSHKGELKVIVKEAKHLPLKSNNDVPSTFCKIILHPKKKSEKFHTETYYKSTDPVWESTLTFEDVLVDELRTRTLEVILLDEIKEKKGNEFARVRIGSGGFIDKYDDSQGAEIDLWFLMLNNPDKWNSKMIPLRMEEYPEEHVKPKKDKKLSKKDSKEKASNDTAIGGSDSEEELPKVEDNAGSESPRTSALRAMGGTAAANVIEIMNQQPEQTYYPSSDGLHTITEENELEESTGSNSKQSPPQQVTQIIQQHHDLYKTPSITITPDVKPGEPPFQSHDIDDEPEFDYKIPEKKKALPQKSFLKRSVSKESLTSVYSTDSANIYGQVPIRGDVRFGMKYDHASSIFEVHIFQAKDLAAVDTKREISDPYCKVYLLPDKTKSGKRKTRTIKKSLSPEWEEILDFKISFRDLRTRTLSVSLFHQERMGRNVFLGEVMFQMDDLVDNPGMLESPNPKWYELQEKSVPPKADLFKGELYISLMFEDESLTSGKERISTDDKKKKKKKKAKAATTGRINLHIKKSMNLAAADRDGLSDPFCKCYLLPKQNKTKRKTPVIKGTLEPDWDYKTEYDIDYEDLVDHGIEFTVWDWDKGKTNDLLGCTRISPGNKNADWDDAEGIEVLAWQHLIDQPNKWKDFVLPLRSKVDSRIKKK